METLIKDIRYSLRGLWKRPGFTVVALITLALGIGANTAIFSLINAVLIRPLPFPDPDRLVWTWGNIRNGGNRASVAPLDYLDYRHENHTFEQFAAMTSASANLTGGGEPERLAAAGVTGNFFQALGVQPALGRTFLLENEKSGSDQVVVLSYGLWQRRFAGDAGIINKKITLDDKSFEVIGVMPRDFDFPAAVQIWLPLNFDINPGMQQRKAHFLRPIGRLKPGVSLAQAQADTDIVARRLEAAYPETNRGWNLRLVSLREQIVGNVRSTLYILLGAVGFVLLIACANVANLLMAHAASRRREIALRTALGAGRLRIARQLITESVMLALFGGALGAFLAIWGVQGLVALSGDSLPVTPEEVKIDLTVLTFTLLISIATGILFGLAPALQTMRLNLSETLKEGGRTGESGARNRTRSVLVIFETAVAVMLLVGAGLLIRSLIRLQSTNPGFDSHNVVTMRIDLPRNKYGALETRSSFWEQFQSRVGAIPGVEAVGLVTELPLSGQPNDMPYTVEGRATGSPNQVFDNDFRRINQDYFRTMRIPFLRGRNFTPQEVREGAKVLIVSESLVQQTFPNEEPLGKRLIMSFGNTPFEIVGIVGDIRHGSLARSGLPTMYMPALEAGENVVIRAPGDSASIAAAVRRELIAIDPNQPIARVRTMDEWVSRAVAAPRYQTTLLGLFAGLALCLSAVGIYGVMSYSVGQRTREIGVRMALGARQRNVLGLVLRQGMGLVLIGVAIGLAGAFALTRVIASLLFDVGTRDPATFFGVAFVLAAVASIACYLPARRATKVDPMVALRYE
ncbi:MAG TPA: ABC transporter permease [Pyrinomonadaceae bacterium]|nr:ABC transporter permease [Pyrinomonadaceae bacterium]